MPTSDPYENETLRQTCRRIDAKLKPKCEGVKEVDGVNKDCLERKEGFEDRCPICQARGLLAFLREEAGTIEDAARLKDQLAASRRVQRNFVGNWAG